MWAQRLEGGKYRLDNVPSFAYGVSLGDIFEAKPSKATSRARLVQCARGGTLRRASRAPACETAPITRVAGGLLHAPGGGALHCALRTRARV